MTHDHQDAALLARMTRQGGDIVLTGPVTPEMAHDLHNALCDVDDEGEPLIVELTTNGGDAEIGRRMAIEIDRARLRLAKRRIVFLGTAVVYSAGVTIMSAFPRSDRYITAGGMLLIHGRQLERTIALSGPIRASRPLVEALLNEIDTGCELENQAFARLIDGSAVTFAEVCEKALYNWYLSAEDALDRGLITAVV